jgi:hypothetical protein
VPDELRTHLRRHAAAAGVRGRQPVYCSTVLSDGELRIRLSRISDAADLTGCASELVESGLWHRDGEGFIIVEYLGQQRSREQVLRDREANRKRQDDYRERGRRHRGGDHSLCTKSSPHWTRNAVTNGVSNGAQSNPIQSNPQRLERIGEESAEISASALGRVRPASAQDGPHIFADLDFTGFCAFCQLPKSNRLHQKADALQDTAAELARLGAATYVLTKNEVDYADGPMLDATAHFADWTLETQHTGHRNKQPVLTWAEMRFPAINLDDGTMPDEFFDSMKDRIDDLVTSTIRGANKPSDYEFNTWEPLGVAITRGDNHDLTPTIHLIVGLAPQITQVVAAGLAAAA